MNSVILLIIDGLGVGKRTQANPFLQVSTPTFDWLKSNFSYRALQASGIAVGLPWGDPGSSEVGHLTIGAGCAVYQNYPRITMAIRDGSFFDNPALMQACSYAKTKASRLHLIGLFSQSRTHASLDHFEALLKLAKQTGVVTVLVHAITDGKESMPQQAKILLEDAQRIMSRVGVGEFASIAGRYYAMDGNEYWDRTERYLNMLLQGERTCETYGAALDKAYSRKLTDEFIDPSLIAISGQTKRVIQENDAVVLWNFREDGLRQVALGLSPDPSSALPIAITMPPNVRMVTMIQYDSGVAAPVAFTPPVINNTLSEILSKNNKRQLKLAESLKGQLVTYYFNGLRQEAFKNEYQIIIPSDKLFDFAKEYQLKTETLLDRFFSALDERIYDFICLNIANLDVAGHQPNMALAQQSIQYVDGVLNRICRQTLAAGASLIITSDHGNIEQMFDPVTGQSNTRHTDSPVPLWIVDKNEYRARTSQEIDQAEKEVSGSLADVKSMILDKMGIDQEKR
ncbi:MAG: 2,3-bisphosphoglycerate-independent phosphoglycerate mutase [Parcubacteria group bacterium GW2011_GWA1_45_7]|nr:MAG: 2,3-bisphosphoglycerate-independent phosphoglycerate mutase [Parcubacteria group bacterium GW2011_GWA1_45_7]